MAVAKTKTGYYFAAAGDVTTDKVIIQTLIIDNPTGAGVFTFKDSDGDVVLDDIEMAIDETKVLNQPFGERVLKGFEMDAAPTDGVAYVIVK